MTQRAPLRLSIPGPRRALSMARLARWLGPWADPTAAPADVDIEDSTHDGCRVRWYRPTTVSARGAVFIVPGLHYDGPDDPRFERFARVFAASGRWVVAPFLDDYLELRVSPRAFEQAQTAFRALLEAPGRPPEPPLVFSISFGSLTAFDLCASPLGSEVGQLIAFGGYGEWRSTIHFALTGEDLRTGAAQASDPLNRPAVFATLVHAMPEHAAHAEVLVPAWRAYCRRTWGRPELRAGDGWRDIAREMAASLPTSARRAFLVGCGLEEDADAWRAALRDGDWSALDPEARIAGARCPVVVIHGVDDDVIPHSQADAIAEAARGPVAVYRTGLYGHTGAGRPPLRALTNELWTMLRMLRAMAD